MIEFWNSVIVKKSRKKYRCAHCGVVIDVGSSYSRESGKYDGEMQDYALCLRCRKLLDSNSEIWGLIDGELGEFHDKLVDSNFICCPECGDRAGSYKYSDNMMKIEFFCDNCKNNFTIDLSSENLLKEEEKNGQKN